MNDTKARLREQYALVAQKRRDLDVARADLRSEVEEARERGHTLREIGEVLGVTKQSVYDLLNRDGRKS